MDDLSTILYLVIAGGLAILSYITQRRKAQGADRSAMPPFGKALDKESAAEETPVGNTDDRWGNAPKGRSGDLFGGTMVGGATEQLDDRMGRGADTRHSHGTIAATSTDDTFASVDEEEALSYESPTGYQTLTSASERHRIRPAIAGKLSDSSSTVGKSHDPSSTAGIQDNTQRAEGQEVVSSDAATFAAEFDLRKAVVWSEILKPKFDEE